MVGDRAEDKWPVGLEAEIAPFWHEPTGDRQTDVTLHGGSPEVLNALFAMLEASVATEAEEAAEAAEVGIAVEQDPFAQAWRTELESTAEGERAAKIADDVRSAFKIRPQMKQRVGGSAFSGAKASYDSSLCVPCA